MASVELALAAVEDLERLAATLSLPADVPDRVRGSLEALERLPMLGPELGSRWTGLRFLLGAWRWKVLVYRYDAERDRVIVVTVQDARSSEAATATRR